MPFTLLLHTNYWLLKIDLISADPKINAGVPGGGGLARTPHCYILGPPQFSLPRAPHKSKSGPEYSGNPESPEAKVL